MPTYSYKIKHQVSEEIAHEHSIISEVSHLQTWVLVVIIGVRRLATVLSRLEVTKPLDR